MDHDGAQRVLVAVPDLVQPVVEVERPDHAALQRHVGRLVEPRDLADGVLLLVAVAVLGDGDLHPDVRALLEARARAVGGAVAEVDEEVELRVGAVALDCHRFLLELVHRRASAVHWPIRKITYSAGRSAATPIRQTRRPLSRSFCVIVERSHLTKYAFSGLSPRSAPIDHSLNKKSSIVRRTFAHSASPFGSHTAHCVPRSI